MSRRSRFVQPRRRRATSAAPTVDDVAAEIETMLTGVRITVRQSGGYGHPRATIITPTGEGVTFDASKMDLPVKVFQPENYDSLLVRRVDSVADLTALFGEAFIAQLSTILLMWRPLHELVAAAPWGTIENFVPYLFGLRKPKLSDGMLLPHCRCSCA